MPVARNGLFGEIEVISGGRPAEEMISQKFKYTQRAPGRENDEGKGPRIWRRRAR